MKIKVLDQGSIELIDVWGSDERIVEAARMSTGKGFQGWGPAPSCKKCSGIVKVTRDIQFEEWDYDCYKCGSIRKKDLGPEKNGDEKLLAFLYNHKHMTPFEMCGMTIEVKAPIFVYREWHRHRTQCLAGDTIIHFTGPNGKISRYSIEYLWKKWQPTVRAKNSRPERQVNAFWPRSQVQRFNLRCADENLFEVTTTSINDVIRGEPKHMVQIITNKNKKLIATLEHKVFTENGWMILEDAIQTKSALAAEGFNSPKAITCRWERPQIDENNEKWRQIAKYPQYAVSNEGRIKALDKIETDRISIYPGDIIKTYGANGGEGYECVSLRKHNQPHTDACLVHILVLEAFIGPCQSDNERIEARHLNDNQADPRLLNLCWGTSKENAIDRVKSDRQQRLRINFEKINSVVDVGLKPTFDLSVDGPWHNFIANGLVVHNSYNEMSARYIPLPNENYCPTIARIVEGAHLAAANRQAQGTVALQEDMIDSWLNSLRDTYELCQNVYEQGLKIGVPKELARLSTPVARYSRMRASANLRNWLGFLTLRMDQNAQWEIRQYANAVGQQLIATNFPRTWELFQGEAK